MKATYISLGEQIDHTPVSAVAAGDVIVQSNLVAVATSAIAASALGSLSTGGVFDVVHAADVIAAGGAVYWDADGDPVGGTAGTGAATSTSSNNTYMGHAIAAVAETDATVRVKLVGSPAVTVNHYGPLNNLIADVATGAAIPVTASGRVELVTAGVETRTIAAPTFGGQELLLGFKTKVGNCTITIASCDDGNTITFATAGEMVRLVAVAKAAAFVWRVVADPDSIVSTT